MFSPEVRAILEPGCAAVVGTVGEDGWPRSGRAWALTPVADDARLRVVMSGDDDVLVGHLLPDAWVAVTASDVSTLKTLQFKGRITVTEPMNPDDEADYEAGTAAFLDKVHRTDGNQPHKLRRLLPLTTVVFEMVVDQVFDQSPGPAAGRPLVVGP